MSSTRKNKWPIPFEGPVLKTAQLYDVSNTQILFKKLDCFFQILGWSQDDWQVSIIILVRNKVANVTSLSSVGLKGG